jgi:hypothetical protein
VAKHKDWDADNDSGDDSGKGQHREPQKCTYCDEDGLISVEYDGGSGGKDGASSGGSFTPCKICGGTGWL